MMHFAHDEADSTVCGVSLKLIATLLNQEIGWFPSRGSMHVHLTRADWDWRPVCQICRAAATKENFARLASLKGPTNDEI